MKDATSIVLGIQVTEKGSSQTEKQNKFFFRVTPGANKIEIRRAVEQLYNVSVASVNTMNYDGKKKRMRSFRYGRRANWKRAVVTLKKGSTIDLTK
jgi:large subunit ribosomal protein L23